MVFEIQIGGERHQLEIREQIGGFRITNDGTSVDADAVRVGAQTLSLVIAGRSHTFAWARQADGTLWLGAATGDVVAEVLDPRRRLRQRQFEQSGKVRLVAPMAGKVVRLLAAAGDMVESTQGVVVLEAMKMQNEVRSPKSGTLVTLVVAAGESVAAGQLLGEVE